MYEEIAIKNKTEYRGILNYHTITFVLEGDYKMILNNSPRELRIKKDCMYVLPKNTDYRIYTQKEAILLSIDIGTNLHIFENFFFPTKPIMTKSDLYTLPIIKIIQCYLNIIRACLITDKEISYRYREMKLYELAVLIKNNYSPESSERMFHTILDVDHAFIDFVTSNFMNVKSVEEFASLYNISLSAFYKQFRKNFKQSPYSWMKTQKTIHIKYMINDTHMTLTEISDMFGFSSLSQFSTFCKTNLGQTPSTIRKHNIKK